MATAQIKEKDKTTERMWEGELALCRWQNSVPFRTCHRILRTVFSSRPLGHFSSSSRTVWSTNSKTRYSLFFLRNTSIRFTRWSCRSCCNTMEKLCTSSYSTCVKFKNFPWKYISKSSNFQLFKYFLILLIIFAKQ